MKEGINKPKVIVAKCIAINGNTITLQIKDGELTFDTDEPECFVIGKEYEVKDELTKYFKKDKST